ncbi:unnamed protein product [Alternaria alternata]
MSTSSYPIYDTLPDASDHLRLLTVHTGSISVPIRCTLRTVSFRDKPSYDALSYAWGDSACTKPIDVDGSEIQVTVNLEQALRHLRDVEHDLVLWVDAICINQSDASEKSHQVAFMGDIYRECDQVRIWLGCDSSKCNLTRSSLHTSNATDESHGALDPFELVCHLADGGHIRDWPCFLTQSDHGSSTIAYKANDLFDNIMEAFRPVIQNSWWTRMWTVQEAILPNKGLLTYDTWSTSLQTITDCGRSANGQWPGCCRDAFMKLPEEYLNALQGFFGITNSIYLGRERNDVRDVVRHSLHRQHFEYGYRGCKDPRDKVYALLGIVNDVSLKPSYICSTNEVFLRATCHTLFYEKSSLKSLTGALYGPATGKCASWVCQFDAPFDRLCYFKADNSGQGLCYPNACVGDEVWVLDGGKVPFILRPIHLDAQERAALKPLDEHAFINDGIFVFQEDRQPGKVSDAYYEFIGDCYFDGFMHGEAMDNTELLDQTIVLV